MMPWKNKRNGAPQQEHAVSLKTHSQPKLVYMNIIYDIFQFSKGCKNFGKGINKMRDA